MIPKTTVISVSGDGGVITIKETLDKFADTGDIHIMTYNHKKKKTELTQLSSTRSSSSKDFISIETELPDTNIILTPEQRVYCGDAGAYKRSMDLTTSCKLLHVSGEEVGITRVDHIRNKMTESVYSLILAENTNYFANGVLISC